jgi:hypothetical protein
MYISFVEVRTHHESRKQIQQTNGYIRILQNPLPSHYIKSAIQLPQTQNTIPSSNALSDKSPMYHASAPTLLAEVLSDQLLI